MTESMWAEMRDLPSGMKETVLIGELSNGVSDIYRRSKKHKL